MKHIYLSDNAKFALTPADRTRHTRLTVEAAGGKCQLCDSREADYHPCADEDRFIGHILCHACRVSVSPAKFRNTMHVPCISRLPTSELVAMAMRRSGQPKPYPSHVFVGGPIDGERLAVQPEHDEVTVPFKEPDEPIIFWDDDRHVDKIVGIGQPKRAVYKRTRRRDGDVFVCRNPEEQPK